jgi:hypothetical protein
MFSESCSAVSVLLTRCVGAGALKSTKIRHRPSIFLLDLGPLRLILHWTDGKSPSSIMYNIWV